MSRQHCTGVNPDSEMIPPGLKTPIPKLDGSYLFECSLSFISLRCKILPPYDACFFISYCVGGGAGGGSGGGGGRIYLFKKSRENLVLFFLFFFFYVFNY